MNWRQLLCHGSSPGLRFFIQFLQFYAFPGSLTEAFGGGMGLRPVVQYEVSCQREETGFRAKKALVVEDGADLWEDWWFFMHIATCTTRPTQEQGNYRQASNVNINILPQVSLYLLSC